MSRVSEFQFLFREGVVSGDSSRVAPLLVGGKLPEKRFAIHQRNYQSSLVTALATKFPATVWLVGSSFFTEAAARFVRDYSPQGPIIAEYGGMFPHFLASSTPAGDLPYLEEFAELEWRLGHIAIAVSEHSVPLQELQAVPEDALPATILRLQPGLSYFEVTWPVDELIKLYLNDSAPAQFSMHPEDAALELQGARGEFVIQRLERAEYIFRNSISEGRSIGEAAEHALEINDSFDPGPALVTLFAAELVTGIFPGKKS